MEKIGATDFSDLEKSHKTHCDEIATEKRKLNVQFSPRKRLNPRKTPHHDRPWSSAHRNSIPSESRDLPPCNNKNPQETVILINPSRILPSHTALEDSTSRSTMPETAVYPSVLQNAGSSFILPESLAANTGYMMPATPNYMPLPTMDPSEDLDGDQYHEIMQGLLQAIHNQNRIMEECRNILTSIHRAIVPFQPLPIMVPSPQLPLNLSSQPSSSVWENAVTTTQSNTTDKVTNTSVSSTTPADSTASISTSFAHAPATNTATSFAQAVSALTSAITTNSTVMSSSFDQPQPASKTTQTSLSKEPEKPAVFGPDGEFSSAYLRYVHGKSSTATSFANVLMKEVFTLEERISSNCNGVMGKKALEPNRLDKIKRAVRRFYTDTEDEFQDMWKKCRKSIDSTNRNLKFVIMKKPNV